VKVMVQAESSVAGVVVTGVRTQSVTVAVEPSGWAVTSASTLPWGGLLVPAAVSVTVTVQVAGALAGVEVGQSTVVEVLRAMTVIVSVPVLEAWIESGAGWYVAVIV
jgi:hypothetical protein